MANAFQNNFNDKSNKNDKLKIQSLLILVHTIIKFLFLVWTFRVEGSELGWYIDMRRKGSAPTAGFGLGFERLIQEVHSF